MTTSMAELFKQAFGLNWEEMEIGKEVDVSEKGVLIDSFNPETGEVEANKILKAIRKPDAEEYSVSVEKSPLFSCSGDHKVAYKLHLDKAAFGYTTVNILVRHKSFYLLDEKKQWVNGSVKKLGTKIPILDVEVDQVHNYFSEGILSHNTMFGNPETTPAGKALKFAASLRIRVARKEDIKDGDKTVGMYMNIVNKKNKVGPAYKRSVVKIIFGEGLKVDDEVIEFAVASEIIVRKGTWYFYGEERLGQGKENAAKFLLADEKLYSKVKAELKEKLNPSKKDTKEVKEAKVEKTRKVVEETVEPIKEK